MTSETNPGGEGNNPPTILDVFDGLVVSLLYIKHSVNQDGALPLIRVHAERQAVELVRLSLTSGLNGLHDAYSLLWQSDRQLADDIFHLISDGIPQKVLSRGQRRDTFAKNLFNVSIKNGVVTPNQSPRPTQGVPIGNNPGV